MRLMSLMANITERESALAKSREQRLADERDYKRRRKTYRTKSGQKKAIEIQRDLVEGYMNDLSILYDRRR
ncbi:hypothetical protein K450DRAFT_262483 [Umbelopsis ramanniana AG]|uniref:Uncharacterized protein n=1 Tax=Umbelopsis ramanniana AG TaxID=1314678 RepID=A0AAD5E1P3_UMBRA|nr:uncharacterized protein K450DRAFT_262483 [Umbelopsis ramanniana AG]KAI8575302.1 hypothetical protein K450DRAFT_262483 [Umbelopsis ramanniana AG]